MGTGSTSGASGSGGLRVFSVGWSPYTWGYWCRTSRGWYWVGYEPFAWVTYHYGYWHYDSFYGWIWIPDYWNYRFTAANCYWYYSGRYIAWYPAPPPPEVAVRLNIQPRARFDFARAVIVNRSDFLAPNIQEVLAPAAKVAIELRDLRPSFTDERPPHPAMIERATGQRIVETELDVKDLKAAGGAEVTIAKPVTLKPPPRVFRELDQTTREKVTHPAKRSHDAAPAASATRPRFRVPDRRSSPTDVRPPATRDRSPYERNDKAGSPASPSSSPPSAKPPAPRTRPPVKTSTPRQPPPTPESREDDDSKRGSKLKSGR